MTSMKKVYNYFVERRKLYNKYKGDAREIQNNSSGSSQKHCVGPQQPQSLCVEGTEQRPIDPVIRNLQWEAEKGPVDPAFRNLEWETEKEPIDPVFRNLKWILTKDDNMCDLVVSFLESKMDDKQYVGLDIEYDPCFHKGQTSRTALLQLGVHTGHCLLLQVVKMKSLPSRLVKLLTDPKISKVGVGIQDDVIKLFKDFNVRVQGCLDLREIAPRAQKKGLAALARAHLNTVLPKSKKLVLSKWSKVLSPQKQAYAAKDAYVAVLLTPKLVAKKLLMPEDGVTVKHIVRAKELKPDTPMEGKNHG